MGVYNYTKTINSDKLLLEIQAVLSIVLNGTDGCICFTGDNVDVKTDVDLSAEDKTILDGIVSAHSDSFPEADFNILLFFKRFAETFDTIQRLNFAKLAPSFTSELSFFNFAEVKVLRDYVVSTEELSQADADSITALFAEQNIDLDSY